MRTLRAAALAAALLAAGCGSPTDPGRPGFYTVVFLGTPPGAEAFTPVAVEGRRVYGVASAGGERWPVVWHDGTFARLLDPPPGCAAVPWAARGGAVVGQVTCGAGGDPAGAPADAFGWGAGPGVPSGRVVAAPHGYRGVSSAGVVGTIRPRGDFPGSTPLAFFVSPSGGVQTLLPPGAEASAAAGIADDGTVAVTAFDDCSPEECVRSRVAVRVEGEWRDVPLPSRTERAVAIAVSSRGDVLGYASGAAQQPFVRRGGRTRLLPVVPGTQVVVEGVNALGQVVGTGTRAVAVPGRPSSEGLLWGAGRQYFLRERIRTDDWEIPSAHAIDDQGFVAATGVHAASGRSGAVLLVPVGR